MGTVSEGVWFILCAFDDICLLRFAGFDDEGTLFVLCVFGDTDLLRFPRVLCGSGDVDSLRFLRVCFGGVLASTVGDKSVVRICDLRRIRDVMVSAAGLLGRNS